MILTLFSTTVVLGLMLRPPEGWLHWASDKLGDWKQTITLAAPSSFSTPNPPAVRKQVQYEIDAVLDTKQSAVRGVIQVTLPSAPDNQLLFYLYPSTYKPILIEQVQLNGKPVSFSANDDHLTIPGTQMGDPATVRIRFVTAVPQAGTRLGEKDGVWSLTYWYPILGVREKGEWIPRPHPLPFGDPFVMDLASYHVRLKHPTDYTWYTSGVLQTTKTNNGITTSEWSAHDVRSFGLVGGTGWKDSVFQTPEGVNVTVAVQHPDRLSQLTSIAQKAFAVYTHRFGKLTSPSFAVLEMPTGTVFAHEYPNLALFSSDIWDWSNGEHWIVHEIAHAWWFSSVGTYKAMAPWLDEGLADYAAYLYEEETAGKEAYQQAIARNWQLFRDGKSYAPHQYGAPVHVNGQPLAQPYANFTNEADYYYLMYLRPVLMYHDLRNAMGDQKFFDFLQQFYLKNMQTTTTRQRLEEALQDVSPDALPRLKMWLDTPNEELIEKVKTRF